MIVGAYVPGTSRVHRAPAGAKLLVLSVAVTVVTVWRTPAVLLVVGCALAVVGLVSGVGVRALAAQLRPVLIFTAVIAAVQVWLAGPRTAALVAGALLLAVAAAGLVTLTTRTTDLIETLVRLLNPLRRLGVDPERASLLLALTVRSIPVIAQLAQEVRDARRARGAERSLRAFAVPLVIRTVRHADRLGEALAARGVDD